MTNQNNAAQPGLTDGEREHMFARYFSHDHPCRRDINALMKDIESALLFKLRAEGVQAGDERAAFEADYAKAWNAAYENKTSHTAEEVAALREGDGYGEENVFLNARWRGWQARAAMASAPVADIGNPISRASEDFAHEVWAAAQSPQGEPIEKSVARVASLLTEFSAPVAGEAQPVAWRAVWTLPTPGATAWCDARKAAPPDETELLAKGYSLELAYAAPQASEAERSAIDKKE